LPASNELRREVLDLFGRRFGVPPEVLERLTFEERHGEIWARSAEPPSGLVAVRPVGIRALRRQAAGIKPTSAFLILLGDRILASRVELALPDLRLVLLGHRIRLAGDPSDGYVALCHRGDVLGCGRLSAGLLSGLLPTGRRRELLAALEADLRGEPANL